MNPESYAEFIDIYDNHTSGYKVISLKKDLWKDHPIFGKKAKLIPYSIAKIFVDDNRLKTVLAKEKDYVYNLAEDIKHYGFKEPLQMKLDPDGKICLTEGHHRMIVCDILKLEEVPIYLDISNQKIRGYGRSMTLHAEEIWSFINLI